MKTVYKFQIAIAPTQLVRMQAGARIIHVGLDPVGRPCVWAVVDPSAELVDHSLHVSGTGQYIPDGDNRHLGSFVDGAFVWHVWIPC